MLKTWLTLKDVSDVYKSPPLAPVLSQINPVHVCLQGASQVSAPGVFERRKVGNMPSTDTRDEHYFSKNVLPVSYRVPQH
jgi:hypothetical protein